MNYGRSHWSVNRFVKKISLDNKHVLFALHKMHGEKTMIIVAIV